MDNLVLKLFKVLLKLEKMRMTLFTCLFETESVRVPVNTVLL